MLLECLTHRRRGHYEGDAQQYRDPNAEEEWLRLDPIPRLEARALESRWLDEDAARAIERDAKAAVEQAVEFARASPLPDPDIAQELVYAG
jgi:pyruvate dehydrogenase E1 component alpha subunit